MRRFTVTEKTFLKDFALRQFNQQFGNNIQGDDCDIYSIEPEGEFELGYEIISLISDNTFKIRMFLNIRTSDNITPFRLNVAAPFVDGGLGDEVFITSGTVDSGHHLYDNYPFYPLQLDDKSLGVLMTATLGPIELASGGYILIS